MNIQLDREKIDILLANNIMTVSNLADKYGCSRQRMVTILKQQEVLPATAGKISKALGVESVTEIMK